MQFTDGFQKDLLYTIFGGLFILQVFHAYPQQQQGIPLQQDAEPFIVMVFIKMLQQFGVADMVVFTAVHKDQ